MDNYEYCKKLSKEGSNESLNRLLSIYLESKESQKTKDARKALMLTRNKSGVIEMLHARASEEPNMYIKLKILRLGIWVCSEEFMYEFLMTQAKSRPELISRTFKDIVKNTKISYKAEAEAVRFMQDTGVYSKAIARKISPDLSEKLINTAIEEVKSGKIDQNHLSFLHAFDKLGEIQDDIRCYILLNTSKNTPRLMRFLDPSVPKNAVVIEETQDLGELILLVYYNTFDYTELANKSSNDNLRIAVKAYNKEIMSCEERDKLVEFLGREIEGVRLAPKVREIYFKILETVV